MSAPVPQLIPLRHSSASLFTVAYWMVVTLLFGWAARGRFALPLDPIADPDTWGYLSPGLSKLTGHGFVHAGGRNFVYPSFLFLLLRAFGDFRAITIAQHLLGLAAGGFLLASWQRARDFLPRANLSARAHAWLGLAPVALYLLAIDPMRFETDIRPEGVCGFLLCLNLWALFAFLHSAFIRRSSTASPLYGIVLVLSALLLGSAKPNFWLAAIASCVPVGWLLIRPKPRSQRTTLAFGVLVVVAALLLPERYFRRDDGLSRTFVPTMLFVMHADLIRDQMSADATAHAKLPYPPDWLERTRSKLTDEIKKSAVEHRYPKLGFDPEDLMFNSDSIAAQLGDEFGNDLDGLCRFYQFYYWRVWRHQPIAMIKKTGRQLSVFYLPKFPIRYLKDIFLSPDYRRSLTALDLSVYRDVWQQYPAAVAWNNRCAHLADRAPAVQQLGHIRKTLSVVTAAYLPLLLLTLGLSALIFTRPWLRERLGWAALLTLIPYGLNFVNCLEVALVNSLEVGRYITVQMPVTIFGQFMTIWLVIELVRRQRAVDTVSA